MDKADRRRLLGEVINLQRIIQERRHKREPFLSSFADVLDDVAKKAEEWFEMESKLAKLEVSILRDLVPKPSFADEKSKLEALEEEFNESAAKFKDTINSIRKKKMKRLKDFEGRVISPELLSDFKNMFDVCVKLEELIDQLVPSVTVALRIAEIYTEEKE